MNDIKCYFCDENANQKRIQGGNFSLVCPICGFYELSISLERDLRENLEGIRDKKQGLINCAHRCTEIHEVSPELSPIWVRSQYFDMIKKNRPKEPVANFDETLNEFVDHASKPNLLIELVSKRLNSAFDTFVISKRDCVDLKIADENELRAILNKLKEDGYLEGVVAFHPIGFALGLNLNAWELIKDREKISDKVFVAIQFEWSADERNLRIDVLDAITRACSFYGLKAGIVDQTHTDNISDRILSEIRRARFVVADLTYHNQGVYFESGFARGLGKKVFHVIKHDHVGGDETKDPTKRLILMSNK